MSRAKAAPKPAAPRRTASAPKPAALAAALQSPSTVFDRPDNTRTATPQVEERSDVAPTPKPEVRIEPETPIAAPSEPDVRRPEASEPEIPEPEAPEPEIPEPEASEPEIPEPEAPEPEPEAATAEPEATESEPAAPVAEPETAKAEPAPSEPTVEAEPEASTAATVSIGETESDSETLSVIETDTAAADADGEGASAGAPDAATTVLSVQGLTKRFDGTLAVDGIDIDVTVGSIFGIVGPNGAGKTTTLSMVTGLLRPDAGTVHVHGADVWKDPVAAKRNMGVLPDRLRLFDRLTGAQLLYYSGTLRGLDRTTVKSRTADLAAAFGLEEALGRLVTDYSAGMTKKIALAAAMIHSPRLLILDEPFEAVDPVSAANIIEILQRYAAAGGTVVMSSHSMDLIQRICDAVSIIVRGSVLASGTMDEVRAGATLEDRFVELAGGRKAAEGMEWLHSFSA